jgi:transcription elongation factor Elf1
LFCNHENSVAVKLDKKAGVGALECKVCGQKFQCGINCMSHLSANK